MRQKFDFHVWFAGLKLDKPIFTEIGPDHPKKCSSIGGHWETDVRVEFPKRHDQVETLGFFELLRTDSRPP